MKKLNVSKDYGIGKIKSSSWGNKKAAYNAAFSLYNDQLRICSCTA